MSLGLPEAFEKKVHPEPNSGCWLWAGPQKENGYGHYTKWNKVTKRYDQYNAHRYSYSQIKGPFTGELDHSCNMRCCVNPDHLEIVTHRENMKRAQARRFFCRAGHPNINDNYYWWGDQRYCRACRNEQNAINNAKRRTK